nr:hypothetical protein 29 [bacterium]
MWANVYGRGGVNKWLRKAKKLRKTAGFYLCLVVLEKMGGEMPRPKWSAQNAQAMPRRKTLAVGSSVVTVAPTVSL